MSTLNTALEYLTKITLQSDPLFLPLKQHVVLISKVLSALINSLLIFKCGSTFGDYVLNYVKLDTSNLRLVSSGNKKIYFIAISYLIPIFYEIVSKLSFSDHRQWKKITKIFILAKQILDLIYNLSFVFIKSFTYSDVIEHLLGIMTVNEGSKKALSDQILNLGKQINLFFLYIFIKLGEWYYSKETKSSDVVEIEPPKRHIKNISENCPVCSNQIIQPTAVKCCGCVYCDTCIKSALKKSDQCPVCKNEISELDLIRIFN